MRIVIVFVLLIAPIVTNARNDDGRIDGIIVDVAGARVADAQVVIATRSTRRELQSDESGEFHANIAAGTYRIKVVCHGFKTASLKNVRVQSGTSKTIKVILMVGRPNNGGNCPKGISVSNHVRTNRWTRAAGACFST
jgi:Carboxypeptidase regulatory-like domain